MSAKGCPKCAQSEEDLVASLELGQQLVIRVKELEGRLEESNDTINRLYNDCSEESAAARALMAERDELERTTAKFREENDELVEENERLSKLVDVLRRQEEAETSERHKNVSHEGRHRGKKDATTHVTEALLFGDGAMDDAGYLSAAQYDVTVDNVVRRHVESRYVVQVTRGLDAAELLHGGRDASGTPSPQSPAEYEEDSHHHGVDLGATARQLGGAAGVDATPRVAPGAKKNRVSVRSSVFLDEPLNFTARSTAAPANVPALKIPTKMRGSTPSGGLDQTFNATMTAAHFASARGSINISAQMSTPRVQLPDDLTKLTGNNRLSMTLRTAADEVAEQNYNLLTTPRVTDSVRETPRGQSASMAASMRGASMQTSTRAAPIRDVKVPTFTVQGADDVCGVCLLVKELQKLAFGVSMKSLEEYLALGWLPETLHRWKAVHSHVWSQEEREMLSSAMTANLRLSEFSVVEFEGEIWIQKEGVLLSYWEKCYALLTGTYLYTFKSKNMDACVDRVYLVRGAHIEACQASGAKKVLKVDTNVCGECVKREVVPLSDATRPEEKTAADAANNVPLEQRKKKLADGKYRGTCMLKFNTALQAAKWARALIKASRSCPHVSSSVFDDHTIYEAIAKSLLYSNACATGDAVGSRKSGSYE